MVDKLKVYILLDADTPAELSTAVEEKAKLGYVCSGGVEVVKVADEYHFLQPMQHKRRAEGGRGR